MIVACVFTGYTHWEERKKLREELTIVEAENKRVEAENKRIETENKRIRNKFNSEMVGRVYEGSAFDTSSLYDKVMQIKILDDAKLQYKLGEKTFFDGIKWREPKIVTYSIETENGISCFLCFDDFKTDDLLNRYTDTFKNEFSIDIGESVICENHFILSLKK